MATVNEVLRLAASGVEVDVIASQFGITTTEVVGLLSIASTTDGHWPAPVDLEVELRHLSLLRRALMPAALRGDPAAAVLLLRLAERRDELRSRRRGDRLGADALRQLNDQWKGSR